MIMVSYYLSPGDLGGEGDLGAGNLGGFVSIQGGNKAIWEPKVRPWQVTAKSSQVKPSQGKVEVPNVVEL